MPRVISKIFVAPTKLNEKAAIEKETAVPIADIIESYTISP